MSTKVTMPQFGESVMEGTVGRWLVSEGDAVQKDQPLVEILTDKADNELPSPVAGVVTKVHAGEDDVLAVGELLCEITEGAVADATPTKSKNVAESAPSRPATAPPAMEAPKEANVAAHSEPRDIPASPAMRKLARERGVPLESLVGSAPGGRITRDDVVNAGSSAGRAAGQNTNAGSGMKRTKKTVNKIEPAPSGAFRVPPYVEKPGDEIVPFSRRRRIIADHMVYSKATSPDVVTFAECDLHKTAKLRNLHKGAYKKDGLGLTYLAFVTMAVARALKEFPEINARVLDDAYVKFGEVNVGIAVDTPQGLVVPVIKRADELSMRGIARAISDLGSRGRSGELTPDDLAGKTFTVSNPGRKGNLVGGAIISQPNVGILRLGTIKKRVVVVEHDGDDLMAIHPVMHMALTYDHRVVDGVHANSFLYRISEILEEADFEV